MDWTAERVEKLAELWKAGLSASQVARQLGGGLSRNAVIGKIHRMGLKARVTPSRPRAVAGPGPERARRATTTTAIARSVARAERIPTPRRPTFELTPTACIHTLTEATCRWPIGDPGDADFGYCGRVQQRGAGSYCEHHARVAFRAVPVGPSRTERRAVPMHAGSRNSLLGDRR